MTNPAEAFDASQGWPLRQAMERTVDPDVWRRCLATKGALQETETPIQGGSALPRSGVHREKSLAAAVATDNAATQQFRRMMTEARLVAFDCPEPPKGAPRSIPPATWKDLVIADLEQSVVQVVIGLKTRLHKVSIFPIVHSPDAPARLAGLSLVEAFRRSILDDPEIEALATRAFAKTPHRLKLLRDGQVPSFLTDYKWPLDMLESNLAHDIAGDFFVMVPGPPRPVPTHADRALAHALIDRLSALRRHLTNGRVLAQGMFVNSGMMREINPLQWARHGLCIDAQNGDLLEGEHQTTAVRWSGILLLGAAGFHVKPTTTDGVRSSAIKNSTGRPGRKKTTPLNASIALAVAALWPNGVPEALLVQSRDKQIIAWQMANKIAVAGSKSIYRFFKDRPSR